MNDTISANAAHIHSQKICVVEPVFNRNTCLYQSTTTSNTAIVLLHGLNSNANMWTPQITELSKYFHVISIDLPGLDTTFATNATASPENYARMLHFFMQRYVKKKFHLLGHSFGAAVALKYAALYPQDIKRLVLVDVAGILHRNAYAKTLSRNIFTTLKKWGLSNGNDIENITAQLTDLLEILPIKLTLFTSNAEVTALLQSLHADPHTTAALFNEDFNTALSKIHSHTLILWGEYDFISPRRVALVLHSRIRKSTLTLIPLAAHSPQSQQPVIFNKTLLQFLNSSESQLNNQLPNKILFQRIHFDATRSANCRNNNQQFFEGIYKSITLEHCDNVIVKNIYAESIVAIDSSISMDNCVVKSNKTALKTINSTLVINNCVLQGNIAIHSSNSHLDLAAVTLSGDSAVIVSKGVSTAVLSVSKINTLNQQRYIHGFYTLNDTYLK